MHHLSSSTHALLQICGFDKFCLLPDCHVEVYFMQMLIQTFLYMVAVIQHQFGKMLPSEQKSLTFPFDLGVIMHNTSECIICFHEIFVTDQLSLMLIMRLGNEDILSYPSMALYSPFRSKHQLCHKLNLHVKPMLD